ncbi:hypothetical protein [Micromonospora sp. NPDC005174]|uniref:hypothetical protein n=1 Tax=unclassified Micromonospora TaxID=2617518 RepID=UPI0033B8AC67
MHIVPRLRRLLTPTPPPVLPGTGQRIQAAEQAKAKQRLLAHARSVAQAHRRACGHDGPAR